MYYKDLDRYRYLLPVTLPGVLTVGWLSRDNEFPRGEIPADLVRELAELLSTHRVNQTRGFHVCELCPPRQRMLDLPDRQIPVPQPYALNLAGQEIALGSAEVWVPSVDRTVVYA